MIVLQGAPECVDHLEFSPDAGALAALCSKGLQLWNGPTFTNPEPRVIESSRFTPFRFTPDGGKILLGGTRSAVFDLATGKALGKLPSGCQHFDVSPDGQQLLIARSSHRLECRPLADLSVDTWAISGGIRSSLWPPIFLPDGKRFLVSDALSRVSALRWEYKFGIRETATGKVLSRVSRQMEKLFKDPAVSSDRRLVAARRGVSIAVFRTDDLAAPPTMIRNDNRQEITGLAFHPSGRYLAATSNDNTVKLYDTSSWQMAHAFNWNIGRLRSIAFSSDGMLAAAGGDKGKIVVWDVDL
jgi:WD40 repeat protein